MKKQLSENNYFGNFLGIDPGSSTLGVAVFTIDFRTNQIVSSKAFTLKSGSIYKLNKDTIENYGERLARINSQQIALRDIIRQYRPFSVGCESPFYSQRMPNAYAALVEVLTMIRNTVIEYQNGIMFEVYDPPNVKKAVGAAGNADKFAVRDKVLNLEALCYYDKEALSLIDEHSVDALAVGYAHYNKYIKNFIY